MIAVHIVQSTRVDLQMMAQVQTEDPGLDALVYFLFSLRLTALSLSVASSTVFCDISTGSPVLTQGGRQVGAWGC